MYSVIFMGTPDFAVPSLESLFESPDYDVRLVICQPDKPQGRHQVLTPPPVKELALSFGAEVYQPASMKTDEVYEKLASYSPDFIVVAAYGKILPARVLELPKYGCVNLHGSLLPAYRGAAPIQWSVINGDAETGVTTMLMDVGLDTGDMLLVSKRAIGENETAGEVFDALAALCPELLDRTLKGLAAGEITPVPQDESKATHVGMLSKEMAVIDWSKPALTVHNLVRGMNPWPVAKTMWNGKGLKIYASTLSSAKASGVPGSVSVKNGVCTVACGDGCIEIRELQADGSKRMGAADFLRGHPDFDGAVLG